MSSVMLCGKCGASVGLDERFCGTCGSPREQAVAAAVVPDPDVFGEAAANGGVAPPNAAPPPYAPPAAYEPVGSPPYEPPAAHDPMTSGPYEPAPQVVYDPTPVAGNNGGVPEHLLGEAAPNMTYLGMRLRYEPTPEALFNPLTNKRWVLQAVMHAFVFWFLWSIVGFCLFFVALIMSAATKSGFFMGAYFLGALVSGVAVAGFWFFKPFPALLSEWKFSVDGKGAAERTAFEQIAYSFQQRRTPVEKIGIRRITQAGMTRDYLEVRSGIFFGYVSCFAYGRDLFIAWTFWLNLSPARWCLLWLKALWLMVTMRGSELYVTLRFDDARAMREALHAASREGVDVAAGEIAPQGTGTVGGSIAIDLTELATID